MSLDPRTQDEIYQSLKSNLQGKISGLTNFVENSFNYVWTQAFAREQHEQEVAATAVQLSGWANYAGKTLTSEDLDDLDIDGATAEEINQYVEDEHLDEFAKAFGVARDLGSQAVGEVEVTVSEATTIPEGVEFGTEPDSDGEFLSFFTTESVSTNSATTVTVSIQAAEVGTAYNVGANTITHLPNPPTGVESVTNPNATTGGEGIQSNSSLRDDIKNAIIENSGGGTKDGVEAYIENNTAAIQVTVDEKYQGDSEHGNYPHGDVIVLGGTDSEVEQAIAESHPSAVQHILVRPTSFGVNVTATVEGSTIDTTEVENDIEAYFDDLLLAENVYRDKIIQTILNADDGIENIDTLEIEINEESHTYDSDNSGGDAPNHPYYILDKGDQMEQDTAITEVLATVGGSADTVLAEGTDYEEYDSTNNDYTSPGLDSVNFDVDGDSTPDGDNPDEDTIFEVTYRIEEDIIINNAEVATAGNISVTTV